MTEYMVNYVCAKTVPDSTKLYLIKSKFSGGAPPGSPYFTTCFPYRYVLAPPIIYTISFCCPLLRQKTERNHGGGLGTSLPTC